MEERGLQTIETSSGKEVDMTKHLYGGQSMRLRSIPPRHYVRQQNEDEETMRANKLQAKREQLAEVEAFLAEGLTLGLAHFAECLRQDIATLLSRQR